MEPKFLKLLGKDVCFRVDSSRIIGSGHFMRCLTLANEFRMSGSSSTFFCHPFIGNIADFSAAQGHNLSYLSAMNKEISNTNSFGWLPCSEEEDAISFLDKININSALCVVDHYSIGKTWHTIVERKMPVLAIDDLANREIGASVLLDYNFPNLAHQRYSQVTKSNTKKLIGNQFTPFRVDVRNAHKYKIRIRKEINKILIFLGGSDLHGFLSKAIKGVLDSKFTNVEIVAVSGFSNKLDPNQKAKFSAYNNLKFIESTENFANFMIEADLCIGAVGSTSYERALLGLPSICVTVAENQMEIANAMQNAGVIVLLGEASKVTSQQVSHALNSLNSSEIQEWSTRLCSLFKDSNGSEKVVAEIENFI